MKKAKNSYYIEPRVPEPEDLIPPSTELNLSFEHGCDFESMP